MKNKKIKKISLIILSVLVLILFILPFGMAIMVYEDNFGERYETYEPYAFSVEQFDNLQAKQYSFSSNKGQKLAGYLYSKNDTAVKGIIVIAHGLGGGGHNSYMDVADYFTSNGYYVFAYDATGNDESEGKSVIGLPQGIIDLDYALHFIKEDNDLNNLPIMLFGHSWGGYSVCNVLNIHNDIKAVVSVAGFNESEDILEEQGRQMAGDSVSYVMPSFKVYETIKFGKYAGYSGLDGLDKSGAAAMIIHSKDDDMISKENSYDVYYNKFKDNPKFVFLPFEDRGHNYVYYSDESRQYQKEFNDEFKVYVDSLDQELTAEIKTEYLHSHLDKEKMYDLDDELMEQMLAFYDTYAN